ncbi:MAG: hypothetical protein JSU81_00710 [Candidatus Coatesbacteria bacterium]|nr:MAG: hypothetical protein JSU81_00710 [Candidatus Coatesbacteria bacterium]
MRIFLGIAAVAASAASVFGTHGILLVSDQVDGVPDPQYFDSYYRNALRNAKPGGYKYVLWDHYTQGSPTFEELRKYKVVIWYTSTSGQAPASDPLRGSVTLTPAEQEALVAFLSQTPGTTTLMLSGMYIAWNCVADAVNERQYYKPLFSDYLKLNYPRDNFDNWIKVEDGWKLVGEAGCPVFAPPPEGPKTYTINWRHHMNFPDQLESAAGGSGSAWWQDLASRRHHRAVIRAEGRKPGGTENDRYKIVLFACPFENILHDTNRTTVMKNFLEWAGNGEPEIGVAPTSLGRLKALYY